MTLVEVITSQGTVAMDTRTTAPNEEIVTQMVYRIEPAPGRSISVVHCDISTLKVDAIVTAANQWLRGGGGVDGAIHRAAGPGLLAECQELGGCPPGEARATSAYKLGVKHVIHAVGPIWRGGEQGEAELLAACYRATFELAEQLAAESIAVPAISTGIYKYPLEAATKIAVDTCYKCLLDARHVKFLFFSCFDEHVARIIMRELSERIDNRITINSM
jgi:O-acetyl-ADP-ribose deacetylase